MREIIFDTETTGIGAQDGHRIIEIGAVEMIDRQLTGNNFHLYLNPEREVDEEAQKIHGYSWNDLKDKPVFADIIDEFWAYFAEGKLVAHNAKFDIGFFDAELARVGRPPISRDRVIDTLGIAKLKFPGARNSLDGLCARFGISNAHRTLHGALLDSELLSDVYIELTGGRQTNFLTSNAEQERTNRGNNTTISAPQRQREKPLAFSLSEEEAQAHKAMVSQLGENPVWNQWLHAVDLPEKEKPEDA